MSKWNRFLRVLTILFGAIAIAVISCQIVSTAGHKLLWGDEGNEILNSCSKSYSYILIHGASAQCSPAPLYYILQKSVVSHVPLYGKNILYFFRAVSIVSTAFSLIFLFFGFTKYLGLPWGLFGLLMMNHGQFHYFGAENRPYMLWIFVFSGTLIIVSSLAHKPWNQVTVASKINLAFLALALTLVASGGMVQTIGFLATLLLWDESLKVHRWIRQPSFKFVFPVVAVSCALGIYYAIHGCLQYDAGKGDLLRTRDWTLVTDVISLLWPLSSSTCRDYLDPCGLVTGVFNFFVLAGVAAPFLLWKNRKNLSEEKKFLLSVSVVSIVQIFSAVVIGILVARAHYYFIQRVFIYLVVLRASLVVCGGYVCFSWVLEKWNTGSRNLNPQSLQVGLVAVLVLGLSASIYRSQRWLSASISEVQKKWPVLNQAICPPTRSPLATVSREEHSIQGHEEYGLNFIVIFGEQLKACGWAPADAPPLYVVPKLSLDGKTYSYQITEKLPVGSSILGFFHRPLSLEP